MKKLFTLVALLAMVLGAQAGEKKIYSVDYSTYTAFPFYVMGYVPEWNSGIMTDLGGSYTYANKAEEDAKEDGKSSDVVVTTSAGVEYYRLESTGTWHQYFIADNIPTEVGGAYHVKALVKASKAVTINVNMGWNWSGGVVGADVSIPAGDDFVEVEWNYTEIGGSSCNLVAQPNTDAQIEWKSLEVYTEESTVPVTWLQMLTNDGKALDEEGHSNKYMGDAEFGAWPEWSLKEEGGINANWRGDRTGEICAWALTMGKNLDDGFEGTMFDTEKPDRSRPYPADIELEEGTTNHVFAVHVDKVAVIDDDANSIGWSNQFWIQSPKEWKTGTKVKLSFRYKADRAQNTATQIHTIHPSKYLHWQAIGDVAFTTEWQEKTVTLEFDASQGTGASLCFNLTTDAANDSNTGAPKDPNSLKPNVFYFDDLSWEVLKLDEGYFVAGKGDNVAYDYAQAIEFKVDPTDAEALIATIGTVGNKDSWVNEVQISQLRGDNSAFLGATLKPTGSVKLDEDGESAWLDYTPSSQAKIKLPAAGVYLITIAPDPKIGGGQMMFKQLEGDAPVVKEAVAIVTNATEVTVKAKEREYTEKEAEDAGIEKPANPGQTYDNQFFLIANRALAAGEKTHLTFQYKRSNYQGTATSVTSGSQCHNGPGQYIHWKAIGSLTFTEEWSTYDADLTVPAECDGTDSGKGYMKDFKSIAFDLAMVKEACDYEFKNFKWYLVSEDDEEGKTYENLIDETGAKNLFVKEGAGTSPREYGTDPAGITNVVNTKVTTTESYNLAGQRVSKDYKGIVVKNGKKIVVK